MAFTQTRNISKSSENILNKVHKYLKSVSLILPIDIIYFGEHEALFPRKFFVLLEFGGVLVCLHFPPREVTKKRDVF